MLQGVYTKALRPHHDDSRLVAGSASARLHVVDHSAAPWLRAHAPQLHTHAKPESRQGLRRSCVQTSRDYFPTSAVAPVP
jgi:hypothetical protein